MEIPIRAILILIIQFIPQAFGHEAVRIDKSVVEEMTPYSKKYELIISDNCLHCLNQIKILKSCVEAKDVVVLMENKSKLSEEKLKRLIKKKGIPYAVYLLDTTLSNAYGFKGITPTLWIIKGQEKKSYTGVVSCDYLRS